VPVFRDKHRLPKQLSSKRLAQEKGFPWEERIMEVAHWTHGLKDTSVKTVFVIIHGANLRIFHVGKMERI
jgi:hypothetical protein